MTFIIIFILWIIYFLNLIKHIAKGEINLLMKKVFEEIIDDVAMEISVSKEWRKRIFQLLDGESLEISYRNAQEIPEYVRDIMVANKLTFLVSRVNKCEEYFDNSLVIFKFWTKEFSEICSLSGNNPKLF